MLLFPPLLALFILAAILNILKIIPVDANISAPVENALTWTVFSFIPLFILIPVVGLAQSFMMQDLGYTKCEILAGHPNMYFTDWVKDPSWCVQGKSRDWVREQAASRSRVSNRQLG